MGLRSVGMCSRCPGAANTEQRLQADPQRLAVPTPLLEATQGVKRVHTCLVKKDHGLVSSIKVKILCALPHCCSCSLYHWSVFLTWVSQLHTLYVSLPLTVTLCALRSGTATSRKVIISFQPLCSYPDILPPTHQ